MILTILANAAYEIGQGQGSATVTILDNTLLETPTVSVVATDPDAAEPSDSGRSLWTRRWRSWG